MSYFYLDNIKENRVYEIIYNDIKYYFMKYEGIFYDVNGYDIGKLYKMNIKKKLNFEINKLKYIKYREIINFEVLNNNIIFLEIDMNQKVLY